MNGASDTGSGPSGGSCGSGSDGSCGILGYVVINGYSSNNIGSHTQNETSPTFRLLPPVKPIGHVKKVLIVS